LLDAGSESVEPFEPEAAVVGLSASGEDSKMGLLGMPDAEQALLTG